jgi:DNA ligase 1
MHHLLQTRRAFVASIALLPALAWAERARPPLPLLLAQEAPPDIDPNGFLVSEKYDGVRAHWDGQQALRFRSGAAVPAPQAFLSNLPSTALDGELWL